MKKRKSRLGSYSTKAVEAPPRRRRPSRCCENRFRRNTEKREAGVVAAFFVAFLAATDMTKAKHYRPPVKTSLPLLYLFVCFFFFFGGGLVWFF
jgi:hypothetical protein